ncbi:GDP-mannose-dependent alpha-mannosyltransferase [compost metagenome]
MASGLPVVAANSGGVREMVLPGETGVLCAPRQTQSFVQEICSLVDDIPRMTDFRAAARQFALGRSWDAIFDQLLHDYEQIIDFRRIGKKSGFYTA